MPHTRADGTRADGTAMSGDARFATEATLVAQLSGAIDVLAESDGGTWMLLNEHTVIGRIPDVTALRIDVEALRVRLGTCCRALSEPELRALRALRPDRSMSLSVLARTMRVGESTAKRTLRGLIADALVQRSARGTFVRLADLAPIVDRVVTFEAKRSDWRTALLQARAHQSFADFAWVAYDAAFGARFDRARDIYDQQGVGLVEVDARDGGVRPRLRSRLSRLRSALLRALNTERALGRLLGEPVRLLPQTRLPSASASSVGQAAPDLVGPLAKTVERLVSALAASRSDSSRSSRSPASRTTKGSAVQRPQH